MLKILIKSHFRDRPEERAAMPSRGHWRAFTCPCIVLLALVSSEKERRVFKLEGLAETHPAGRDYFSFASSSKCSAAAAGPCFAFRRSQWGLPNPAIGICITPGPAQREQSPVDLFSPHKIGTMSPCRWRKLGQGCSARRDRRCLRYCDIAREEQRGA